MKTIQMNCFERVFCGVMKKLSVDKIEVSSKIAERLS
jgi:hypothetical protein